MGPKGIRRDLGSVCNTSSPHVHFEHRLCSVSSEHIYRFVISSTQQAAVFPWFYVCIAGHTRPAVMVSLVLFAYEVTRQTYLTTLSLPAIGPNQIPVESWIGSPLAFAFAPFPFASFFRPSFFFSPSGVCDNQWMCFFRFGCKRSLDLVVCFVPGVF